MIVTALIELVEINFYLVIEKIKKGSVLNQKFIFEKSLQIGIRFS